MAPWIATGWLGFCVAGLSLAIFVASCFWPGRSLSTRQLPADVFRIGTGIAFAGWVHPAFGILAVLGAVWWVQRGWERLPGGTL